jgi:uncharacterized protein
VILIDSNIFMYAAGASHPHKAPSVRLLEGVSRSELDAAIDAEVLQEILHRYRAIGRWEDGRRVFDLARRIVPTVLPVTAEVMDDARTLMDDHPRLSARDAVHAAVVRVHGLSSIYSYDRDFEAVAGLRRMEPPTVP